MYGDADEVCPMDQVEWLMDEIGHLVYGNYQFGGYDHADFGKAQGDVFMQQINDALYHLDPSQGLTYELTYADEAEYAFETAHEMQQRTQEYDEELNHYLLGDPVFKFEEPDDDHDIEHHAEPEKVVSHDLWDSAGFDLRGRAMVKEEKDRFQHFHNEKTQHHY